MSKNRSLKTKGRVLNKLQLAEELCISPSLMIRKRDYTTSSCQSPKQEGVKLIENYSRAESIRLLNVVENQVLAAVKVECANKVEFHAVHRLHRKIKKECLAQNLLALQ